MVADPDPSSVDDRSTGVLATPQLEEQVLLILVGLPGSSKSTFANALVGASLDPAWSQARHSGLERGETLGRRRWTRVSQDEAPSRRRQECERQVVDALGRGDNVVVDRVNFDPSQRAHFIALAENASSRPKVCALTLDVSIPTLQARLGERVSHPTIPDAETGIRVLNQMTAIWDPPRLNRAEGFDRVYTLPESRQPPRGIWTSERLGAVLDDIEAEGETETGPRYVSVNTANRGRGGYAARGRGYGHGEHRGGGRGGHWGHEPYRPRYDAGPASGRGAYGQYAQYRPNPQASRGAYRPQHAYAASPYGPPPAAYAPAPRPPFGDPYAPQTPLQPPMPIWSRQPDATNAP